MTVLRRRKFCECGCGVVVKKGRRFIAGHSRIGTHHSEETIRRMQLSHPKKEVILNLCLCGCGELVRGKYKRGHWGRNRRRPEEIGRRISLKLTGKKRTQESIEKQRAKLIGRKQSPESIEKRRKSLIGIIPTEEKKKKISVTLTGRKHPPERVEKTRQSHLSVKLSPERVEKSRLGHIGLKRPLEVIQEDKKRWKQYYRDHPEARVVASERMKNGNSPFYIDGRCSGDNAPYPFDFNRSLKELIRERDEYKCQLCFTLKKESGKNHPVHHIDYNKENCDPRNLITLCKTCHGKTSSHRDKWITLFQSPQRLTLIMGNKG